MGNVVNPCTRCGKQRVFSRQWKESVPKLLGGSIEITHVENVCPDSECQKIVEEELRVQRVKKEKIKNDREKRMQDQADKRLNVRNSKKLLLKK